MMSEEERRKRELEKLRECVERCKRCPLHAMRKNVVVGEGSAVAELMMIGEAPGYNEDLQGRPFVGKAGKVLDSLLQSIGLDRASVYICNVLKCRPPKNREPSKHEIAQCTPFLDEQISIIKPRIIATLGNYSMQYIFSKYNIPISKISEIHGSVYKVSTLEGSIFIVPLYHPAVAVYNIKMMDVLLEDFKVIQMIMMNNKNRLISAKKSIK
ncbi:MAG: uracil-DNA glycosylase [Canidatus Methanoxibalbensis ujae]|nr:uracil-DNA glycosylase [Candidatus Methanoxibalbensis ujae]